MRVKSSILIVDDVPENITILGETLGDDYDVRFATNGDEALAQIGTGDPVDLVLLDIMMPGIDGYEVCRRLKANPATQEIPVIFLTSREEEESEARGLELGAVDYIKKPFNPSIVKARIKGILRLKLAIEERLRARLDLAQVSQSALGDGRGRKLGNYTLSSESRREAWARSGEPSTIYSSRA